MSLLRLLAAGKSLVGLEGSQSRYQVTRQRLLPRFGSKKNPFRGTIRPEAQSSAVSAPPLKAGQDPHEADGRQSLKQESRTASEPGAPRSPEPAAKDGHRNENPTPQLPARDAAARQSDNGKFTSRLTALFPWRRVETGEPFIRELPKPLVQAELSLESVKVVRNDLSDCDLEVVRSQPPPPRQSAAPIGPQPPSRPTSHTRWSRVTGRLFGLGKL